MSVKYARPFSCIMVNMPGHFDGTRYVCKSFNIVRDRLRSLGYSVRKVRSRWSPNGHFLGAVVIEFGRTEADCESAFKLQKMFEVRNHGIADWGTGDSARAGPYLWVATTHDAHHVAPGSAYVEVPPALRQRANVAAEADIYNPYDSVVAALYTLYPAS